MVSGPTNYRKGYSTTVETYLVYQIDYAFIVGKNMNIVKINAIGIDCNSNCAQARVYSKNCNTYNTNWLFEKVIIIKVFKDTFRSMYYNLLFYWSSPIPICALCIQLECSISSR